MTDIHAPFTAPAAAGTLEALLEQADTRAFIAEIGRLMAAPTATVCAQIARALQGAGPGVVPWAEVRMALVASFTIDPLAPFVTAFGAASGLLVRTYAAGGDQWLQETLDPSSGMRQFEPDVVVVALQVEDLAEPLVHDFLQLEPDAVGTQIDQVASRVRMFVESLRSWSSARILLHGFPLPVERSLGILDPSHDRGQTKAIRTVEQRVREQVAPLGDVYFVDVERVISAVGYSRWHDPRLWTLARIPYAADAMQALAQEYLKYLRAFTGRTRKVLALDLDDTLWGGIAGEDGPEGIQLGVGHRGRAFVQLQRALRELARRGVLLAVNSKNNPEDALEIIDRHPAMLLRRDDFAAVRINWQDKAANLLELAEELGVALDSFVYVDDSAAECERVRQALPEVMTVHLSGDPSTYADTIKSLGVFDRLSYGDEDRTRTAMYRSESRRRESQQSMASLDDFYRSLESVLDVERVGPATIARAAELTQRTNQFNLTTRRFTQDELRDYLSRPGHEGFAFRLRDRFGDHGIIGVALLERHDSTTVIDTLLLSCRVLKRTVEDTVLSFVCDHAGRSGAALVEGRFRPTRKNAIAAAFYESHGFTRDPDGLDGVQRFVRRTSEPLPASPWITCHVRENRHA